MYTYIDESIPAYCNLIHVGMKYKGTDTNSCILYIIIISLQKRKIEALVSTMTSSITSFGSMLKKEIQSNIKNIDPISSP